MAVFLDHLSDKVDAGEPLTDAECDALDASRDIVALGMLANVQRRKLHGSEATYLRLAEVDVADAAQADAAAHATPVDEAGEVRIACTPATLDAAVDLVARARDLAPRTPLSAFCLSDLARLPEGLPVVLLALKHAGLDLVAQASVDRLDLPEQALEAVSDAGLGLARLTVGQTPPRPWTAVCRDVARYQAWLRTIRAFAPLPQAIDPAEPTTGYADVKRVAIARLVVTNVDTIQVDWGLYGPKLAQVALTFGADDLDGVSAERDDSRGQRRSPVVEIQRCIRAAGFEPVERDGRFERRG